MRRPALFAALTLACGAATALTPNYRVLNHRSGFSGQTFAITQDDHRLLWLLQDGGGLTTWDGSHLTTAAAPNAHMRGVSRQGDRIWSWFSGATPPVSYTMGRPQAYESTRFGSALSEPPRVNDLETSTVITSDGPLAASNQGVLRLDDGEWSLAIKTPPLADLHEHAGVLYAVAQDASLWRVAPGPPTSLGHASPAILPGWHLRLRSFGQRLMVTGTRGGLSELVDGRLEAAPERAQLPQSTAMEVLPLSDGRLAVGTDGEGLWLLSADGRVERIDEAQGLPEAHVIALFEDAESNLYASTAGGGIYQRIDFPTMHLTTADGLGSNRVRWIADDREGRLGVLTIGATLAWFTTDDRRVPQRLAQRIRLHRLGLIDVSGFAVFGRDQGYAWGRGGLARFSLPNAPSGTGAERIAVLEQGFGPQSVVGCASVRHVVPTPRGFLAATQMHGVVQVQYDADSQTVDTVRRFGSAEGLGDNAWQLAVGSERIHVATTAGLIDMTWAPDTEQVGATALQTTRHGESLRGLLDVVHDGDDLWLTARSGVLWLSANRTVRLNRQNHLPSNSVYDVLPDGRGHVWVGTSAGMTRLTLENDEIVASRTFTSSDGLLSNESNGYSGFIDAQGTVWLGFNTGATGIPVHSLDALPVPPAPRLVSLSLDGAPIKTRSMVRVDRDARLRVEFSSATLAHASSTTFRLAINGREWPLPAGENSVIFDHPAPKTYEMEVAACNADGECSDPMRLTVDVEPAWWSTWTFITLVLILLAIVTIAGYRARLRVIADRIRARAAERENRQALEYQLERARLEQLASEQALRARDDTLAHLSHEVRTPLQGVVGLIDVMAEGPLTREQRRTLDAVRDGAHSLQTVIDDVLDLSKLDAGKLELNPAPMDPLELIETIARGTAARATRAGLLLIVDAPEDLPSRIVADASRVRQVLMNLASNAVKFTDVGHIIFGVEVTDDEQLCFRVTDTGCGIAPERLSSIFEAYGQGGADVAARYGGTGLGLAICRRLATAMGGTLQVESEVGVGTTFRFSLSVEFTGGPRAPITPELNDRRVLVVCQSDVAAQSISRLLTSWNAHVTTATQWSSVDGLKNRPNLVVVDQELVDDGLIKFIDTHGLTLVQIRDLTAPSVKGRSIVRPVTRRRLIDALQRRPAARRPAPATRSSRILIVEDNPVNQIVMRRMLEKQGHQCVVVDNGQSALGSLRHTTFDLVLMDLQMPGMDGYQTAQAIRSARNITDHQVNIVAVSAHIDSRDRDRCRAVGMQDCVSKPVSLSHLSELVQRYGASTPPKHHRSLTPDAS